MECRTCLTAAERCCIVDASSQAPRGRRKVGAVMASEYNTRPLIPEVLVRDDKFAVIRARPTFDEMINRDTIPEWL